MRTIRMNVFETNSSSCHVMTVMNEEQLAQFDKKWNERRNIYPAHWIKDGDSECDQVGVLEIIDDDKYVEDAYKEFSEIAKTITKENVKAIFDMVMKDMSIEDILKECPSVNAEELKVFLYTYGKYSENMVDFCETCVENSLPTGNGKYAVILSMSC